MSHTRTSCPISYRSCELSLLDRPRSTLHTHKLSTQCCRAQLMLHKVSLHPEARLTLYDLKPCRSHGCSRNCAQPRCQSLRRSILLRRARHIRKVSASKVFSPESVTEPSPKREVLLDMSDNVDLADYVCNSPIAQSCGVQRNDDPDQLANWQKLGELLSERLGHPAGNEANQQQRARVYQYYLPIYLWLSHQLQQHKSSHADTPLFVGMSAPQGSGKTTICEELEHLLAHEGYQGVFASLDDFYLTNADQQALAKANEGNKLLELRSNAGTHDIKLAHDTLQQLKSANSDSSEVSLVRYDKSAHSGRGDRAPKSDWQTVKGKVDVVLFEGWMLGFRPLLDQAAQKAGEHVAAVNDNLKKYPAAIDNFINVWLIVKVVDPKYVYAWRQEAEHKSKAKGKSGMTDEQVKDFVDRYMPAYQHYLPGLYAHGPTTKQPGKVLTVQIDKSRQLTKEQPAQYEDEEEHTSKKPRSDADV